MGFRENVLNRKIRKHDEEIAKLTQKIMEHQHVLLLDKKYEGRKEVKKFILERNDKLRIRYTRECSFCKKVLTLWYSCACGKAWYCGESCQKSHWREHKEIYKHTDI